MSLPDPSCCLITDRQILRKRPSNLAALVELTRQAAQAGVDIIQIREKDLTASQLSQLVSQISTAISNTSTRLLVNDRVDVALSYGAHGVHLRSDSLPVNAVRKLTGKEFIIGVSTHSQREAIAAAEGGADYLLFGPIFDTPSKRAFGPPQGLAALAEVTASVNIPVLALGGITRENAALVRQHGAAGVAAIRLFAEAEDLKELIDALKW